MKNTTFSDLQYFLEDPKSYPHIVEDLQYIQTHISHVYIAGSFVYKFKKPVDFGFLDYSILQKRKKYCFREVELNRRLTEGIYLGVIGIAQRDGKYYFENNPNGENIVEYAVKMKRLQEEYFLDKYIKEKRLRSEHLERIADRLTAFYVDQKNDEGISHWGEIDTIKVNTDENFDQTESFIGQTIDGDTFRAIKYFTHQYFDHHSQLFQQRIQEGRIVDGHGDLHLDHIHITPEKIQIYDCIEFNDRFRYGDLAADLAFLAMDLDYNNCRNEERYFVDRMSKKLHDSNLLQIMDFYKCYRAYVKGKVKSLQSVEDEVEIKDQKMLAERARDYFKLSLHYAFFGSGPTVIVFGGRVGTGKSTLAKHLSEQLNCEYFSSDVIRKSLAKISLTERTPLNKREALYSTEMSDKTYNKLINRAKESIAKGESVILDATFSNQHLRQKLINTLENEKTEYIFVEIMASDATIIERLKVRENKNDVISDARIEDFEKLSEAYNPPEDINGRYLVEVTTDQSFTETIDELYIKLVNRNVLG